MCEMSDEKIVVDGFGEIEKDAVGEIMNITMGSAATAVSNMLSAKVWITTPEVAVAKAKDLEFPQLEPSIMVRIKYTTGVSGQNVLVLKQNDVQLILNQLMGLPLEVTDDFEFDEMNISAVCEVMNQMMGASATALSEIISTTVDISTPEAIVHADENKTSAQMALYEISEDDYVVTVKFNLTIDNVINSEFFSLLTIDLAKEMAAKMMEGYTSAAMDLLDLQLEEETPVVETPAPEAESGGNLSPEQIAALLAGGTVETPAPAPVAPAPAAAPIPQAPMAQVPQQGYDNSGMVMPQGNPYGYDPNMMAAQGQPNPYMMPPQGGYNQYPPYGYPMQPQMQMPQQMQQQNQANIQPVQLQSFPAYSNSNLSTEQNDNLKLLMNVPLGVTVEIGSTTKKVSEILDFAQGTIIELERQAGAPVDIVVNGNLVAKGDVVVIDDNFAVRITEIVKSKFLDNLGKE